MDTKHTPQSASRGTLALWATGFRPFFLMAAAWAALVAPIWLLVLRGYAQLPLAAPLWHGTEMLGGVAGAVIAGFLLTAVRNWTGGRPTASGGQLAALVGLWAAGRLTMLPGTGIPLSVAVPIHLAFLPALVIAIGRPLVATKNRRNYPILALLTGIWATQIWALLPTLLTGRTLIAPSEALRASLLFIVLLCLVIAGRIVPLFTRNALARPDLRNWPAADVVAYVAAAIALVTTAVGPSLQLWTSMSAAIAALAIVARMRWWGTLSTAGDPMLWILHLGHAWLAVGFGFQALVGWSGLTFAQDTATHTFAMGGVGTLMLGMMVRVTLGHTGRPLRASRLATSAFAVLTLGTVVRVFGPVLLPSNYRHVLDIAGLSWSLAFLLYLVGHARILCTRRPDGRDG